MMGERRVMHEALFYGFSLVRHLPDGHLLRKIDRFVDLSEVRTHLGPYYSEVGRPSIDRELMIGGYCFGIRSERRLSGEPRYWVSAVWALSEQRSTRSLGFVRYLFGDVGFLAPPVPGCFGRPSQLYVCGRCRGGRHRALRRR